MMNYTDTTLEVLTTADQAYDWFSNKEQGVDARQLNDDSICALAVFKINECDDKLKEENRKVVIKAMTLIAEDRGSAAIECWGIANTGGERTGTMEDDELTQAYNHYNIQDRSGVVDMDVLHTMLTMKQQDPDASSTDKELSQKYFDVIKKSSSTTSACQTIAPIDHTNPVGLENLGNTCYLNCLIQYFYAIKGFREIVTDLDRHKLPLKGVADGTNLGQVGGLIVKKAYAEWAQAFLPDLAALFDDMHTMTAAATPKDDLAVKFLVKLEYLDPPVEKTEDSSSTPSSIKSTDDKDVSPSSADSDGGVSDITLVGDIVLTPGSDADDVKDAPMADVPKDEKPLELSDDQKKRKDFEEKKRAGNLKAAAEQVARQQDVHEVAANLINKAVCAMKPTGEKWSGRERDEITKLFYSSIYLNKGNSKQLVVDNTVIIHLHARPTGIPEGLEAAWELDHVSHQYRTLLQPAPILQICFQNQDVVDGVRRIITHPFQVPQQINLTRYMDDPPKELFELRTKYWELHQEIQEREEANAKLRAKLRDVAGKLIDVEGSELLNSSSQFLRLISEELGPGFDELEDLTSTLETVSEECSSVIHKRKKEISEIEPVLRKTSAALNDKNAMAKMVSDSTVDVEDFDYTLFAVFVHRSMNGDPGHGHYYIYIRDFAAQKWRCYNDSDVKVEDGDINDWIHGSTKVGIGRPNLVVYVKSSETENLTQPLYRKEYESSADPPPPAATGLAAGKASGADSDMQDSGVEDGLLKGDDTSEFDAMEDCTTSYHG